MAIKNEYKAPVESKEDAVPQHKVVAWHVDGRPAIYRYVDEEAGVVLYGSNFGMWGIPLAATRLKVSDGNQ